MKWSEELVERCGVDSYENHKRRNRHWRKENPEKTKGFYTKANIESGRKGGKYYQKRLKYNRTGLPGMRTRVRVKDARRYRKYKSIVAPESQVHHQWRPGSADYDCVALVEKNQHQYGIIDVIEVLEGVITLFTEKAIRER